MCRSKWAIFFLFLGLLMGVCCTRDPKSILGDNMHNGGDLKEGYKDTAFEIVAYSVSDSGMVIQNAARMMLGSIYDEVFGSVQYHLYAQLRYALANSVAYQYIPGKSWIDSVILEIQPNPLYPNAKGGAYGRPMTLTVHELLESLRDNGGKDSLYSIDAKVAYDPTVLEGNKISITPKPFDTIRDTVNKTYSIPPIRVHLSKAFGQILVSKPADAYTDVYSFQKYFKGICVRSQAVTSPEASSAASFVMASGENYAKIIVYFDNSPTSTTKIYKTFTMSGARFTGVERNRLTSTDPYFVGQLQNKDTSYGKKKLYVEASGGAKIRFSLPNFKEVFRGRKVIINKASLILSVDKSTNSSGISIPKDLQILGSLDNSYSPDGKYKSSSNAYAITLTRQLQSLLYYGQTASYLEIYPSTESRYGTPCMVRLAGPQGEGESKMKLRVIYTEVKD